MSGEPLANSRVLVSGGAGFLGSVVARRLLDAGARVTVADRGAEARHERARAALPEAEHRRIDLLDVDLVDVLAGHDLVVHLAGRPGVQTSWGPGFDDHLTGNTLLSQRLLEAALVTEPRRIVMASSSSVYGEVSAGRATESQALRPLSPYGVSKAAMEALVGAYAARGVPAVSLRFFTVYGRGQRPDMALHRLIDAASGGRAFGLRGDGRQVRDFTHVDDVAAAVSAALSRPLVPGESINVGGGAPVSLRHLIEVVEAQLGRPVPIDRLDPAGGDPGRTAADLERAERLLAWRPMVDLEAGVADQIAHQLAPAPAGAHDGGGAR